MMRSPPPSPHRPGCWSASASPLPVAGPKQATEELTAANVQELLGQHFEFLIHDLVFTDDRWQAAIATAAAASPDPGPSRSGD